MTRHCPNCSEKHQNPGNAYCEECADYFASAGMYSRLSDDGLTFSADDGASTRADNFTPRCVTTGEDVDDCHCVEGDYDEIEEADARLHAEREERD